MNWRQSGVIMLHHYTPPHPLIDRQTQTHTYTQCCCNLHIAYNMMTR